MKNFILIFFYCCLYFTAKCQLLDNFTSELDSVGKYSGIFELSGNRVFVTKIAWRYHQSKDYKYLSTAAKGLLNVILKSEEKNFHGLQLADSTRYLLSLINDPYVLTLIDRAIVNYEFDDNTFFSNSDWDVIKQKLRKDIGERQAFKSKEKFPFYTYDTHKKQMLKFVYLHHGNDLIAPFHANMDRDYTGSLKIELGTDYLNLRRKRPVKSYQTLIYGLEVYTGNIRNSSALVDSSDRPFGSFSYFGWGKYKLSRSNRWRHSYNIKLGIIGGNGGRFMQNQLHTDISFSKVSLGWDNQIVDGGRIGISIESKRERQFKVPFENFYLQPFIATKVGSFMTNGSLGLRLTNREFSVNSFHDVNLRNKHEHSFITENFKWFTDFQYTKVIHNSMLTGFGYFSDKEAKQYENDFLKMNLLNSGVPFSKYILRDYQINKNLYSFSLGFSYSTRYMTIIYRYYWLSPETKLDTHILQNNYSFNLSTRWHKFAEVGLSLNLK